jgi:hypothetical protein
VIGPQPPYPLPLTPNPLTLYPLTRYPLTPNPLTLYPLTPYTKRGIVAPETVQGRETSPPPYSIDSHGFILFCFYPLCLSRAPVACFGLFCDACSEPRVCE